MVYFVVILMLMLAVILFIPVKIRFLNIKNETDIYVSFANMYGRHFDFKKFIRAFYTNRLNREKISISEIIENVKKIQHSKSLIHDLNKKTKIIKTVIISNINVSDGFYSPFVYTSNWIMLSYLRELLHLNFSDVQNEYFGVVENYDDYHFDVDFDLIFEVNMFFTIMAFIKNIRELPDLYRRMMKHNKINNELEKG